MIESIVSIIVSLGFSGVIFFLLDKMKMAYGNYTLKTYIRHHKNEFLETQVLVITSFIFMGIVSLACGYTLANALVLKF